MFYGCSYMFYLSGDNSRKPDNTGVTVTDKEMDGEGAVLRLFYGFIGSCERDEYSS